MGDACRARASRRRAREHSRSGGGVGGVVGGGAGGGGGVGSSGDGGGENAAGADARRRRPRARDAASSHGASSDAKRRFGNSLHHSGGVGRDQVGADLLAEIARRNQADMLLYRAARREFEAVRRDAQPYLEPPLRLSMRSSEVHGAASGGSLDADGAGTGVDDGLSDAQREELAAQRREGLQRARARQRARRRVAVAEDDG